MSIVDTLKRFKAGELPEDETLRALVAEPAWHVPVDADQHAALYEIEGRKYLAAMSSAEAPDGGDHTFLTMRGRHLVRHLPSDADGLAFDLARPHGIAIDRTADANLRFWASALDAEDALRTPAPGQAALLADHDWFVLCADGVPQVAEFRTLLSVRVFTAPDRMRHFLQAAPGGGREPEVRRVAGRELLAHLAERDDWDAIHVNPLGPDTVEPWAPAACREVAEGRDPRPTARILKARSIAEIHLFLDQEGAAREDRKHQMESVAVGDRDVLVARYDGKVGQQTVTWRFEPVNDLGTDPDGLGQGPTSLLCAGVLVDVVRRRLSGLPLDGDPRASFGRLLGAAQLAAEVERLFPAGVDTLPRWTLRTAYGARMVRERPELATRTWVNRARRIAETLSQPN